MGRLKIRHVSLATGIRLYLYSAQALPVLARFLDGKKLETIGSSSALYSLLPPDIQEGIDKKCFIETPMSVALDLIAGIVFAAVNRIVSGVEHGYTEHIVEVILRGLGVDASEARAIVEMPIIPFTIPPDSLLIRAHLRFIANQ